MQKNRLLILSAIIFLLCLSGCAVKVTSVPDNIDGHQHTGRVTTEYADKFTIDRYGDISLISVADGGRYLIVPKDSKAPSLPDKSIKIIKRGDDNIYLAASAVMDLIVSLGSGENIKFVGTKQEDWYIPYTKEAMQRGEMRYAGKYREPDYELLVSNGCDLSIQSTMIEHTPEVREKLEELGITVFTDYSSYEEHPLGRCEWIKVYGEILGKTEEADELFREQTDILADLPSTDIAEKKSVFFYVNNAGDIVARKKGDYISKMIELAGGENIFDDTDNGNSSTITVEAEEFYIKAKDADIIFYNTNVGGDIKTLDELKEKYPLITDFKAYKKGNIWCSKNNLFQETMKTAQIITDFGNIFRGIDVSVYFYKPEVSANE